MKILLLIHYFGLFPKDYFDLFVKSVSYNPTFDFLIFTDNFTQLDLPPNMRIIKMNMSEFNNLATQRLGLGINVQFGYKLCDLRPMYGEIFAKYVQNYQFWGHCDMDLIFGNLRNFLTNTILDNFDIISFRQEWVSGSFALYRNTALVNNLYKESKDWQKVAQSTDYLRFDECGILKNKEKLAYSFLSKGANILDLDMEIQSISYIIEQKKQQKNDTNIRIFQQTVIKESIVKGSVLKYENGQIFIFKSTEIRHPENMQFAHYHFITEKNNGIFQYPKWEIVPAIFYIDETGFYTEMEFENRQYIYKQRIKAAKWNYWVKIFPKKVIKKLKTIFNIK
jgi:hypothetical protein